MKTEKENLIYFLRYYYQESEFSHFERLLQKISLEELNRKLEEPLKDIENDEMLKTKFQYLNDNFILLVRSIPLEKESFDFNISYLLNLNNDKITLLNDNYHHENNKGIILIGTTFNNIKECLSELKDDFSTREWKNFTPIREALEMSLEMYVLDGKIKKPSIHNQEKKLVKKI